METCICVCVIQGFVVVTEMKVLPLTDRPPLGFLPLLQTMDDSEFDPTLTLTCSPREMV